MKTKDFDYNLPSELIAQEPLDKRDDSRLLILKRGEYSIKEKKFKDIVEFFNNEDILVLNKSKVIPARLWAHKNTGAKIEVLLLEERKKGLWEALIRPSRRVKIQDEVSFSQGFNGRVYERLPSGKWLIEFLPKDVRALLGNSGCIPTPPYIKKELTEPGKYQTVFAQDEGSIACPTAGLHFTKELLSKLESKGVEIVYIILHVGLATFRPVKSENVEDHIMENEYFEIPQYTSAAINRAKSRNHRLFACGTSVVRALEAQSFPDNQGLLRVRPGCGKTSLYIYPGYSFKSVDCMITNFHVPRSSNILLVSAFCGKDLLFESYNYAVRNKFRFYSFGDAMLIV